MPKKSEHSEKSEADAAAPELQPVTMRANGQITLPVDLRRALGLENGSAFYAVGWPDAGRILLVEKSRISKALGRFVAEDLEFAAPSPRPKKA